MKVFITTKILDKGIELLKKQGYEVEIGALDQNLSQKEIMEKGKGADALLSQLEDVIDGRVMDAIGPQLKVIANYAVGYDNVDLQEAKKRNILVCNTPGVLTEAVAEHTIGLLLAITRRIVEADKFTRAGKYKGFDPDLLVGVDLQEKTAGIIGHGRIGCRVADILQRAFGMKVLYYDVQRDEEKEKQCGIRYRSFQDVLQESDVVSLHVNLSESTRHLIGATEFRLMKPTSYLINTARGAVVDETALVEALKKKQIQGAAIDVFESEPTAPPGIDTLDNLVITPHIGSASKEARDAMAELAAQNIIAVLGKQGSAFLVQ